MGHAYVYNNWVYTYNVSKYRGGDGLGIENFLAVYKNYGAFSSRLGTFTGRGSANPILNTRRLGHDSADSFRRLYPYVEMNMAQPGENLQPGQRVVLTQQIPQRNEVWTTRITGEVIRFMQRRTGSWYAHARDSKLWLDRLTLRKDDGEIVECILDPYTHIEIVATTGKSTPTPTNETTQTPHDDAQAPSDPPQ